MEHGQRLQAAQYRLAQHYLDKLHTAQRTYQQGNENAIHALALFDRDREQVKQWQAWASAHATQDEQAAAFCSAYAEASPDIFKLRLLPQEYSVWLEAGLMVARRLGDQRTELVHLLGLYVASSLITENERVIEFARQALSIARLLNDQPLLALSLNLYGNATRDQMKFAEAQVYYEQSLVLYETIGDRRGMAEVLNNLGVLALHNRNSAAAQHYLEQCLALNREIGNQEGLATCLNNLGFLANRREQYSAASDYLEQALVLLRVIGDTPGIAMILTNLGIAAYYQEAYSFAREYLEQSLATTRTSGFLERERTCLCRLGEVAMAQGDLLSARDYFEQSLTADQNLSTLAPTNLSNLALIYQQLQQEDRVYPTLRAALEAACRLSFEQHKFMVLAAAARVWVLRGEPIPAATWLGLLENHPHPAIKMADIKRSVQAARAACEAALTQEQFAAAWEQGKILDLDTVIAEILSQV